MNNLTSQNPRISRRGFTLIELLVVIGILAILSTVVVLVINPAELLRQSRDAQRISDLRSVRSAIDFYITRASTPTLNLGVCQTGVSSTGHAWRASNWTADPITVPSFAQPFINPYPTVNSTSIAFADIRKTNGMGWVPVPLSTTTQYAMSGNSPLSTLPVDPNPNLADFLYLSGRFYAYQCQGLTYEINANMESVKYSAGGSADVESTDGGTLARYFDISNPNTYNLPTANTIYEVGNDPGLDL